MSPGAGPVPAAGPPPLLARPRRQAARRRAPGATGPVNRRARRRRPVPVAKQSGAAPLAPPAPSTVRPSRSAPPAPSPVPTSAAGPVPITPEEPLARAPLPASALLRAPPQASKDRPLAPACSLCELSIDLFV